MRSMLMAATAAALLAGCAPTERQMANRAALAEARPIGAPIDCVNTIAIDHTRVRDDRTIDFIMKNGTVYRNRLPHACPSLGFEESFAYTTPIARLCSVDLITVINRAGGGRGPSCGLGPFQPIEVAAR